MNWLLSLLWFSFYIELRQLAVLLLSIKTTTVLLRTNYKTMLREIEQTRPWCNAIYSKCLFIEFGSALWQDHVIIIDDRERKNVIPIHVLIYKVISSSVQAIPVLILQYTLCTQMEFSFSIHWFCIFYREQIAISSHIFDYLLLFHGLCLFFISKSM